MGQAVVLAFTLHLGGLFTAGPELLQAQEAGQHHHREEAEPQDAADQQRGDAWLRRLCLRHAPMIHRSG